MVDAIGPSYPLPPSQSSSSANVPALAKDMQAQTATLLDHLQKVLEDPTLSDQSSFLQIVADNVAQLNRTVEEAIKLR
jgi:hypothetical protein